MKKKQNQKLSLNKFQVAKINNPQKIIGGDSNREEDDTPKTSPTVNQE